MVINVDGKAHYSQVAANPSISEYFTETVTALLEVTILEPVSVAIGKGIPSDTDQTVLELTSLSFDPAVTDALAAGLNLYYGSPFVVHSADDKPTAALKLGYRAAILRVAKERQEIRDATIAENADQRLRDEYQRQWERDQPDPEEWRLVRDKNGIVVDYIYSD